jgi:phosphoribosylaminoimidazole-succinocarboxamide synthase
LAQVVPDPVERSLVAGRSVVARRLQALPIEAIVRGYLIGSGWKDYQATGSVSGVALPPGLRQAERLPRPIFTPATKAAVGDHDENISYATAASMVAAKVRDISLKLYEYAARHCAQRGIIVADTKFEFGLAPDGALLLIDEALTPDSSRFWPADSYQVGSSPPSFDKQFVRDYLETLDWNKRAPGPKLPLEVIQRTTENYEEALRRITGPALVQS